MIVFAQTLIFVLSQGQGDWETSRFPRTHNSWTQQEAAGIGGPRRVLLAAGPPSQRHPSGRQRGRRSHVPRGEGSSSHDQDRLPLPQGKGAAVSVEACEGSAVKSAEKFTFYLNFIRICYDIKKHEQT